MDSSESPVHGQQEGAAYNGHFECVCYHPLFLFNQFGDCEGATLRPGNVHSAEGWQELLEPVVKRYQKTGLRLLFRGDAAWHQGELFPRVGFIVTNLSYPPKGIVRFYNGRGTAEQWIKGGQVRPELDPAFLPQVRGQPGETISVRPDLQPGQLYEKAGVAGGFEAVDSGQSSDQADQDGWATGTPRKEAGVSACQGAGNQGNVDRDTRTDQPASAGTWLACFESTGISDSYGVVRGK